MHIYFYINQAQITGWDEYMRRLKDSGEENGIRVDTEDEDVPPELRIKEKFASFRKYMDDKRNSHFGYLHNIISKRKSISKLGKWTNRP